MRVPNDEMVYILKLKQELAEDVWSERAFHQLRPLFPAQNNADRMMEPHIIWPVIRKWIDRLPDPEKVEEICLGFTCKVLEAGGTLSKLSWWDIDQTKRHLTGIVTRADKTSVHVLFMWKEQRDITQDRGTTLAALGHASWEWDPTLKAWRFAIEGETSDHVVDTFSKWLAKPLSEFPTPLAASPPLTAA